MATLHSTRSVLAVPSEVTEHTLAFCHPRDVAVFSKTCRSARDLIYRSPDQYLWRQLFLAQFDDPRRVLSLKQGQGNNRCSKYDWKDQLQRRIGAESVHLDESGPAKPEALSRSIATFLTVLEEALPYAEDEESRNMRWLARVLRNVRFPSDAPDITEMHRLLALLSLSNRDFFHYCTDSARYGTDKQVSDDSTVASELEPLRTISRCFVYDLRNYTARTRYGPFEDADTINWKHTEYNINVVLMNLREFQRMWPGTRPPVCTLGLDALRAYSAPGTQDKRGTRDWAGVAGHWRRFVCFMDYRFGGRRRMLGQTARDPVFFTDPNFQEATRLVETEFDLIEPSDDPDHDADLEFSFVGHPRGCRALRPDDPPPIHFVGISRGSNGNESNVKGCVRMEAGGIRWRWVSIYDSNTQWSAEGVQIGQVCSAAGVVGNWTGAYHEEGDPAGPYWLWKVPDDYPSQIMDFDDE
ncbi:hypothetical protein GLOTRDRAFT_53694 [Gloeophyllum trabeum ATCC 11539]|uniref:F-box domain-containing protein n=1 Tax=Gloeophyllum trabeum (strain ATCC 11539 / FP-39264 / Madison 617) TaxID=670483 RepID=S7QND2_GLOTA|nr:uncharacterized protein GLOTRDRAFT_53694 [Gloeophyllum trabeum ATCC 11539]EPQ61013.1 hypothetical protein GLOTRDRAFT_53694 [Gloeophyllum trabeum ATCC 11539]